MDLSTPNMRIRLWTWQARTLDPFLGDYDWRKSIYFDNPSLPGFATAYALLAKAFDTDRLLWCYTQPNEHDIFDSVAEREVEWQLELESCQVVAYIDELIWHDLIRSTDAIENLPLHLFKVGPSDGKSTALIKHPISTVAIVIREVTKVVRPGQPLNMQESRILLSRQ